MFMKRLDEVFLLLLVAVLWGCGTQKDVTDSEGAATIHLIESDTFNEGGWAYEIDPVSESEPYEIDGVYRLPEQEPEFPGGLIALMKYINENLKYPEISRENNSQGRAFVEFIVNTDGSISDAEILKSSCDIFLDREALRLVNSMPRWIPAKNGGESVRAYYVLPVIFRLN